jgi:DNA-binding NtrC family response regulator
VRDGGEIEYLKTYRLSDAQVRRAYLLQTLAAHGWELEETAAALGSSRDELVRRLGNAGLGYLLRPHVLDAARAGRAGKAR